MSPHCALCSKRTATYFWWWCLLSFLPSFVSGAEIFSSWRLRLLQISLGKPTTVHSHGGGARYYYQRQKRDDCEAILRIGRFPSPRFVGQPELSPPPQKRRNGFPSKAAALKVPLHTARTVNNVKFSIVMISPGPAFHGCAGSCHENVPAPQREEMDSQQRQQH